MKTIQLLFIEDLNRNKNTFKKLGIALLSLIGFCLLLSIISLSSKGYFSFGEKVISTAMPVKVFLLFMAGIVFSMNRFSQYHNKKRMNTTLLMPASINEKFFYNFLSSVVFYPAMAIIITFFITLLGGITSGRWAEIGHFSWFSYSGFLNLMYFQAIGFFSGAFFKSKPIQGYLYAFLIVLGFSLILGLTLSMMLFQLQSTGQEWMNTWEIPDFLKEVIAWAPVVGLWISSYFVFRKIQLNR